MKGKDVVKWKWDFWLLNINEMEAYCSKINCCRDFEIHAYIQIFSSKKKLIIILGVLLKKGKKKMCLTT